MADILTKITSSDGTIEIKDNAKYEKTLNLNPNTSKLMTMIGNTDITLQANKNYCLSYNIKANSNCDISINGQIKQVTNQDKNDYIVLKSSQNENLQLRIQTRDCIEISNFKLNEGDKPTIPKQKANIIISYLDYDKGINIKQSRTITGDIGTTYNITPDNIDGYKYTLTYDKLQGIFEAGSKTISLYYKESEQKTKEGKVIIKYTDYKTGKEIATSETMKGIVGDTFNISKKDIEDYTYYYSPNGLSGNFTEKDQIIYLIYTKNNPTPKPTPKEYGKVIIEYLDYDNNNEINSSTTLTGEVDTSYDVDTKQIYGYVYYFSYDSLQGKFTKNTKTIRLLYKKQEAPKPPTPSEGGDNMGIATGQFTIVDMNDAPYLSAFVYANHAKTQFYNPDTGLYIPDWSRDNLILTPSILKMGDATSGDLVTSSNIQRVTWYEEIAGQKTEINNGGSFTLSGNNNQILTIKSNILQQNPAIRFIFEAIYKDEVTQLELPVMTDIDFSKVCNGGGITAAMCFAPKGNVFKNESMKTLVAVCDLWRGSVVDTTQVEYQWYVQEGTASDEGAGLGWKRLTQSDNRGVTGYTTREITVNADAVPSFECFKCVITDTDTTSNTYKQIFQDVITFTDNSDPLQVEVVSTGGNIFKNGKGSTVLTARVFRAGQEIDLQGTKYIYKWSKYDKDGRQDGSFGTSGYKDGKNLNVGDSDVYIKATFSCDLLRR